MNNKQKNILMLLFALFIFTGTLLSGAERIPSVTIKSLPTNIDDFLKLRNEIAKTPQGGATIMIVALMIYTKDENLGKQCLVIAVDKTQLQSGKTYKGYSLRKSQMDLIESQVRRKKNGLYIPNSYAEGTSPDNDYKLPKKKLTFNYSINKYTGEIEEGLYKLFVDCSGADTDRPITLRVNDKGLWKAFEWSTLIVGIKPPKSSIEPDDL